TLDHADIAEAADVWRQMIAGARHTIDLAEFYVISTPQSRLSPVIDALYAAAARGVRVRLVVDDGFAKHEAATLAELTASGKLEIRRLDMHARAGGILHAKYFIVDGNDAYLGSQNLDWRSLTHIQELGVRLRSPALAGALADLFETDWALAAGGDAAARMHAHAGAHFPVVAGEGKARVELTPVASPSGWLPDESLWELPRLVALVDGARRTVRVQLLTERCDELEAALRRAAARGVSVELLVSDWCKRKGCVEGLQRLAVVPNVQVAFITIPPWSGGFVPYARVAHAKYLVVDGDRAWVGTSNWERDYFYKSRNVGLIIAGGTLPARLDAFFDDNWKSAYTTAVDPAAH
ncbi:MAG: phospholipase D-like domain-containing protein, partial [Myxococcales bacterium]|nr:phospholipase D-like domain-containing protein [Myxococcales bacterium]